jgi:hypothetical protein
MGSFDATQDQSSTSDNQPSNGIAPGSSGSLGIDIAVGANVTEFLGCNCVEQQHPGEAGLQLSADLSLQTDCTEPPPQHTVEITGDVQLPEIHVPTLLDVNVGGAELGHFLDGSACAAGYETAALEVDVLNAGHLLDAHLSGVADATVDLGDFNWNSDCGC